MLVRLGAVVDEPITVHHPRLVEHAVECVLGSTDIGQVVDGAAVRQHAFPGHLTVGAFGPYHQHLEFVLIFAVEQHLPMSRDAGQQGADLAEGFRGFGNRVCLANQIQHGTVHGHDLFGIEILHALAHASEHRQVCPLEHPAPHGVESDLGCRNVQGIAQRHQHPSLENWVGDVGHEEVVQVAREPHPAGDLLGCMVHLRPVHDRQVAGLIRQDGTRETALAVDIWRWRRTILRRLKQTHRVRIGVLGHLGDVADLFKHELPELGLLGQTRQPLPLYPRQCRVGVLAGLGVLEGLLDTIEPFGICQILWCLENAGMGQQRHELPVLVDQSPGANVPMRKAVDQLLD